ncbi:MAG: pentapeptide repeat-containing protein [Candidatus Eremiobacteraeota bacterium]|nr:pentapeptide repeat-containing protein [Candidatus Eremiobacteraeota bacterium]
MVHTFESIARVGVAILVNGLWQGALIAFITWVALRLFSAANASTRYAVWALALAAVVIVPVATSLSRVAIDGQDVQHRVTPATVSQRNVSRLSIDGVKHDVIRVRSHVSAPGRTKAGVPARASAPENHSFRYAVPTLAAAVAFGLWGVVAIFVVVRLIVALLALERLKTDALPLGMEYRETMPRWDAALKGHRDVRLCVSDEIEVPVAIGLFDSMILLPAHLIRSLEPAEIDQISLHELAHLLRSDDWTNGLQRLACALLFFNPAVLFIARQLDIEREVACDDYVLQLIGTVKPYAFCLTKMAEMTAWPHRALPAPGVFVTRKNISIRIERLLRSGRAIGSSIAPNVAATVVGTFIAIFFVLRTMTPSIAFTEIPPLPQIPPAPDSSKAVSIPERLVPTIAPALPEPAKTLTVHGQTLPALPAVPPLPGGHAQISKRIAIVLDRSMKTEVASQSHETHGTGCVGCDFARANMPNKDFSNRMMEGTNFAHADLHGSTFDHATLTGVNFDGADLRNVSFVGANLEGCNMRGASLEGARFDGATLTGCNIDARVLSPTQARIVLTACEGCDFAHMNLRGLDLRNVHIEGANFAYADLRDTNLSGAMFTGANFSHALLSGARVDNTDFTGCNFDHADLRNVDLSKASMTGSVMGTAIMR